MEKQTLTVEYKKSLESPNRIVIFSSDNIGDDTRLTACNIVWEQDTLFSETAFLELTPFGEEAQGTIQIYNISGLYSTPEDVYYSKIEIVEQKRENEDEPTLPEENNEEYLSDKWNYSGQISFQTISEELVKPIEDEKWKYYLENTKLALFTVPAGFQIFNLIEKDKIYEYVELFYTLEAPIPVLGVVNENVEIKDEDKILKINDNIYTATENWSAVIPGKAIPYNADISKGNYVRADVYLRYWIGEPGERL